MGCWNPLFRDPLCPRVRRARRRGINLEKHIADAEYVASDFDVHSDLIHIFTGVPVRHEWRAEGRQTTVLSTEGAVAVEPRGMHASVRVVRSKPDIQWILEFDAGVISQHIED